MPTYDDFLKLTHQSIIGFMPTTGCDKVASLTSRNMWDLCDIAIKFGQPDFDDFGKPGVFFAFKSLRVEVYNFIDNNQGGRAGMMIGKYRPEEKLQATHEGCFLIELLNQMSVIWD